MHIVTKATAIQFINGKCHIKKRKSHKTVLSGYYACVLCDLLLLPSGRTHTHIQTRMHAHIPTCNSKKSWPAHTWFKKIRSAVIKPNAGFWPPIVNRQPLKLISSIKKVLMGSHFFIFIAYFQLITCMTSLFL